MKPTAEVTTQPIVPQFTDSQKLYVVNLQRQILQRQLKVHDLKEQMTKENEQDAQQLNAYVSRITAEIGLNAHLHVIDPETLQVTLKP